MNYIEKPQIVRGDSGIPGALSTLMLPENRILSTWNEVLSVEDPNGASSLIILASAKPKKSIRSTTFRWSTKSSPSLTSKVTGIYNSSIIAPANLISTGKDANSIIYVTLSPANDASQTNTLLKALDNPYNEIIDNMHFTMMIAEHSLFGSIQFRVKNVVRDGDHAHVVGQLFSAVTATEMCRMQSAATGATVGGIDYSDKTSLCILSGYSQPEGSAPPDTFTYGSQDYENQSTIIETSLSMTRNAHVQSVMFESTYEKIRHEIRILHGEERDRNLFYGQLWTGLGANNKPLRTGMGILEFIRKYNPAGIMDFRVFTEGAEGDMSPYYYYTDPRKGVTAGNTVEWGSEASLDWLTYVLERRARYGATKTMVFCGSSAKTGLDMMAKKQGVINFKEVPNEFGMDVSKITLGGMELYCKVHPRLSASKATAHQMWLIPLQHLERNVIETKNIPADMHFKGETKAFGNGGINSADIMQESYLTEEGFEYHYPSEWMLLDGIGCNYIAY